MSFKDDNNSEEIFSLNNGSDDDVIDLMVHEKRKKPKDPMPPNLYNLKQENIKKLISLQYLSSSISRENYVYVVFLIGAVIGAICYFLGLTEESLFVAVGIFIFPILLGAVIHAEDVRHMKKNILKEYNHFFKSVKGKPFLPSQRDDIQNFYMWLKTNPNVTFAASLLPGEVHEQVGTEYGVKNYYDSREYLSDDYEEYIIVRKYDNIRVYSMSADSPSGALSLALCYQIYNLMKPQY